MTENTKMTLEDFTSTRRECKDLNAEFPGYGFEDGERGYVYTTNVVQNGEPVTLFINRNEYGPDPYFVGLWGYEMTGTLEECERALYDEALIQEAIV